MYGYSSKKPTNRYSGNNCNSNRNEQRKGPRCYQCNLYGHLAKNCDKRSNDHSDVNKPKNALFVAFSAQAQSSNDWYLDSGSSSHLSMDQSKLNNLRKSAKLQITTADNNQMVTDTVGSVHLTANVAGSQSDVNVSNVYFVPDLRVNLLSVSQIVSKGNSVLFNASGAKIYNSDNKVIASATHVNNLFKLDILTKCETVMTVRSNKQTLWHKRMAHLNVDSLKRLSKLVRGINISDFSKNGICEICMLGKSH
uniref:CCHC-type domain-containing protein n=1 Tax=Photinus pyralis TaxID=7054 RepID=A0A1Y1L7Z0_PHOPY